MTSENMSIEYHRILYHRPVDLLPNKKEKITFPYLFSFLYSNFCQPQFLVIADL